MVVKVRCNVRYRRLGKKMIPQFQQVSKIEFELVLHYLDSGKIPVQWLSEDCKRLLEVIDKYETEYQTKPTLTEIEQWVGLRRPDEIHAYTYLKDQVRQQFIENSMRSAINQNTLLLNTDPQNALTTLSHKLDEIRSVALDSDLLENTTKFSDFKERLSSYEYERANPGESEVFKRICGSGFPTIDEYTQGFCRGDLIVIAGRTNEGKSWFSKKISHHVATCEGKNVLLLLYEENPTVGVHVLDSMSGQVSSIKYMKRSLSDYDYEKLKLSLFQIDERCPGDIFLPNTHFIQRGSVSQLKAMIRSYNVDVLIIDQLTWFAKSFNWEDMSNTVHDLKNLARELGICLVCVTQAQNSSKPVLDVGDECVAHGQEIPRTADSLLYVAPDRESLIAGEKYIKLIKTRRGVKDVIVRVKWSLDISEIEEIGVLDTAMLLDNITRQQNSEGFGRGSKGRRIAEPQPMDPQGTEHGSPMKSFSWE